MTRYGTNRYGRRPFSAPKEWCPLSSYPPGDRWPLCGDQGVDRLTASGERPRRAHHWRWVVAGGLVAGTLDITYACVFWALKRGVPAPRIFQSVAAGLLGEASFKGGAATATLGLSLHYLIALSMSLAYYLVARRWALLRQRPPLLGGAYGLLLYGIMNYIVVPLSAAGGGGSRDPLWTGLSIAVHVLLIGIPIALFARGALANPH